MSSHSDNDRTTIILIGTCDTKLDELLFLYECLRTSGPSDLRLFFIDVGRTETEHDTITFKQSKLLSDYAGGQDISQLPRGEVIKVMADCATKAVKFLLESTSVHGVISIGGSGGTSIASTVMRDALPIGFPKLIVSTVASGDTGPIVGETDITLMYSVVDVAGLNQVLKNILRNAAAAMVGMAGSYALAERKPTPASSKRIGITMFGVTTPAVDAIRKHLESKYDVEIFVFHATGHGGKAMERLVREGGLDAVLDLTTTEICDHLTGGVMSAGSNRLEAAAAAGIPNVISVGATDMTNFGPKNTVPEKYLGRKLYEHNPMVTLMRTSEEDSEQVGKFIADQLVKHVKDPSLVQVWLPKGGISMIATPDGPFADAKADSLLFDTVQTGLEGSGIEVIEDERAINDEGFAHDIAEALVKKMEISTRSGS